MKIGLFYVWNVMGGWGASGGYAEALRRMGHEVVEHAFPGNFINPAMVEQQVKTAPTLERLNSCDAIISLHHEYVVPWLAAVYNREKVWDRIAVPIVGRLDESLDRFDLQLLAKLPEIKSWCNVLTYPAAQDASSQKGEWVPHATDAEMFSPDDSVEKRYDVAFIGTLYPSRKQYVEYLAMVLPEDKVPTIYADQVFAQDLSGPRGDVTARMLAENYRQIKIFFCLPPLSRLVANKAFDVMSCGTFVMYPRFPGAARVNDTLFEDGRELVYYELGQFVDNARQIVDWLYDDKRRERVAKAGRDKVRREHTFEKMFTALITIAQGARRSRLAVVR